MEELVGPPLERMDNPVVFVAHPIDAFTRRIGWRLLEFILD